MPVAERTVAAMLALVREAAVAGDMPRAVADGVHSVFGIDYATYDEIGVTGAVTVSSPTEPAAAAAFDRWAHQHPALLEHRRTGRFVTYRLSDLASQRRLRKLELWAEVFRPLGIRYQLALPLHVSGPRLIGLGLNRGRRDFDEDEYVTAELLRTELGYVVALRETQPDGFEELGLSRREAQVLTLALRHPTPTVARMLGISARTVDKHLEHAYRKLGVSSRREAARLLRTAAPLH